MVDLAKIRRKAREQKEKGQELSHVRRIDPQAAAERLENFKRRLAETPAPDDAGSAGEAATPAAELLTVTLGTEDFGIDVSEIEEIVELREITRVPNAPSPVRGIVSVRGTIITVLEIREKLGASSAPADADPKLVIVHDGTGLAGLAVDRVSRVIKFAPEELQAPPSLSAEGRNDVIRGVLRRGDGVLALIDLRRLVE